MISFILIATLLGLVGVVSMICGAKLYEKNNPLSLACWFVAGMATILLILM